MSQLVRFGLVGAIGFVVDAGVLYALLTVGINAYLARGLSFLVAVFVTWRINRQFTFSTGSTLSWREFGRYLAAMSLGGACNYGAYVAMLGVLSRHFWSPLFALAVGSLIGMVVNFLAAKFWVFARPLVQQRDERDVASAAGPEADCSRSTKM